MSIPKEPRQQMINMMYLVLTAMLALNVSAEILRAFMLVNRSLEQTSSIIQGKNIQVMNAFEKKMLDDAEKTKPYLDRARLTVRYCKDMYDHLDMLKTILIDAGGNKNKVVDDGDYTIGETGEMRLRGESNLDLSHEHLLVRNSGARGKKLVAMIKETRNKLQTIVKPEEREKFLKILPLADPVDPPMVDGASKTWQEATFGDIPLAAAVTLLTKLQSDVVNSEAELLSYLINQIDATAFKFDQLVAMVNANSNYVMQGSDYKANIFVSAYSSTQNPEIIIGERDSVTGEWTGDTVHVPVINGIGHYVKPATGIGEVIYSGVINIKGPSGDIQSFPFKQQYMIAVGQAVVSPTKMNVLYIGVDHPLAISASGFTSERVKPSITAGSLRPGKKKGEYVARVTKPGSTIVNVNVTMEDGTSKKMGSQPFRVKRVPPPIAKIANQSGGNVKTGTFKAQQGMIAALENFDFEFKYKIVSFEVTYAAKRQDLVMTTIKGPIFSGKMKGWMKRGKPGDMFYFDNIKARGEDKSTRKLPAIAFKLI